VTLLWLVFVHGFAAVLVMSAAGAALAQAALAPANPQQQRCIEAFGDTQGEKALREKIGKPPQKLLDGGWDKLEELNAWATKRSIAVFGSEKAVHAAEEKVRIEKYTRRFELLRKNAKEGHLPSLYLLASHPTHWKELQGVPGLPTPRESAAAYHTLYDLHFPLAARMMAGECSKAIAVAFPETAEQTPPPTPELIDGKIQKHGTDIEILCDPDPSGRGFCANPEEAEARDRARETREAEEARREARRNAEIAERREVCLDLMREGAFRGDALAWEALADYNDPLVLPVEHYAWLELRKLTWREDGNADEYNVPKMQQDDLVRDVLNEEQRREAQALAEKYARIVWPRRIPHSGSESERNCRLTPQFTGDPEPLGPDPRPR
jgi:hypothetical protein